MILEEAEKSLKKILSDFDIRYRTTIDTWRGEKSLIKKLTDKDIVDIVPKDKRTKEQINIDVLLDAGIIEKTTNGKYQLTEKYR